MASHRSPALHRVCVIAALLAGILGAVSLLIGPADHLTAALTGFIVASVLAAMAPSLRPPSPAVRTAPASPFLATHGALADLTTAEICAAWQHSTDVLTRLQTSGSIQAQAQVLATRGQYLDELEIRNPPGFAAWLRPGDWWTSDPRPYVLVQRAHTLNPIRASTAFMRGALRGRGPPADGPTNTSDQ